MVVNVAIRNPCAPLVVGECVVCVRRPRSLNATIALASHITHHTVT